MNSIYLYDNNFSSLVILIIELIKRNIKPDGIRSINNDEKGLFDCEFNIEIKNKNKNIEYLKNNYSKRIIGSIFYAYLSEKKDIEMLIYEFLKEAQKYKDKVYYHRNLDCVNLIIKYSLYVSREAHKLKGFVRFKEMENNFFYATIAPTNNVISLLGNHFKKRLNDNFVIYDQKRKVYLIYNKLSTTYLYEKDLIKANLKLSSSEEDIEELWKTFHKTVGIKERENLKCQMNFMPKKYWNNMIEMEDKI